MLFIRSFSNRQIKFLSKRDLILLLIVFSILQNNFAQDDQSKLSYAEIDSLDEIAYYNGDYEKGIYYVQIGRNMAKAEFGEMDTIFAKYTDYLGFYYSEMGQCRHHLKINSVYYKIHLTKKQYGGRDQGDIYNYIFHNIFFIIH